MNYVNYITMTTFEYLLAPTFAVKKFELSTLVLGSFQRLINKG